MKFLKITNSTTPHESKKKILENNKFKKLKTRSQKNFETLLFICIRIQFGPLPERKKSSITDLT